MKGALAMTVDPVLRSFAGVLAPIFGVALVGIGVATRALRRREPALARELRLRYAAWLAIAAAVLGALALGRTAWIALVALVSLGAFREYARAVGLSKDRGLQDVGAGAIVLIYAAVWAAAWWPHHDPSREPGAYGLFMAMPAYATLALLAVPVVRDRFTDVSRTLGLAVLGVVHVGWLLAHLAYLVNLRDGVGLVLFLVFLVSLHDVAAFVTGKLAGRHKLRPALSPGKTWEGAGGAVVVVLAAAWGLRWLVPAYTGLQLFVVAGLVGLGATLGDLALAAIKRDVGLKDWGTILPGHGGLLDRVNGLIFTVPLVFHYTRFTGG
jgi:phosphatidate cytidylyltransferase